MPPTAPILDGSGDPHRMVNDSDADRIQREKDRRRAEERLRIEREHHRRLHDVELLRRTAPHAGSDGPDLSPVEIRPRSPSESDRPSYPPVTPEEIPTVSTPEPPSAWADSRPTPGSSSRPIGRPVRSEALQNFLALNSADQFDIQALNQIPLAPLIQEASGNPELISQLAARSEALMERVKREVDDPLSAGALLREFALTWYRQSPVDASWSETAHNRWGGIFAESRITGGKLHPWLNMRLWSIHQQAVRGQSVGHRFRRGLSRSHVAEAAVSRTANQQIQAEVAQAFVDDLASQPRKPDAGLPLVRLSELAVRRQVATVNDMLAILFNSSESGPFVVLHPNRYPDCDELQIRPPSGAASGAALAFSLVAPKGSRRTAVRSAAHEHSDGSEAVGSSSAAAEGEEEADGSSIWEAKTASPALWHAVVEESRQEKRRLDAPPRDYRTRPAYASLREQLLVDAEFRKAFLAVKWRGRPAGLPLLTNLLQKGTITPEVATDHEYLEAELGELSQGDAQYVPEGGSWKFPGWTVVREGSHQEGYRYRAVPDPTGSG
jgi:hypothetical protein